jgi:hypothetical protein
VGLSSLRELIMLDRHLIAARMRSGSVGVVSSVRRQRGLQPQHDPNGDDSGILRTAAQHNAVNVGVYASVVNGGASHRCDAVMLT